MYCNRNFFPYPMWNITARAWNMFLLACHAASNLKYVKHQIEELDKENFVCKYRMIEGDVLGEELESIAHEVKFEAADGGSICKMASKYHTKGKFEIKEEEIKAGKAKAMGIYKVVEAYLLENPHVYA